jgi:hypothetical protein
MAHVRHFDHAIRHLADRGHDVTLAAQEDDLELPGVLADHPRIAARLAPPRRDDEWQTPAKAIRRTRDYVRYLHPRYGDARLLRRRAFEKMIGAVSGRAREVDTAWSELLLGMNQSEQRRLDGILAKLETTIPPDPAIQSFVAAERPDLVVLSPMVGVGFSQADFVKSARALGVPSGMLVFSWDNLSNKGLLHEMPDRMWVWNEVQRREAAELHRFPPEQVVVTGAPRFDDFFALRTATTRDEFCGMLALDPANPIVTYLCSSKFVAAAEQAFVRRWIRELRASGDAVLAGCSLIVRPHPAGVKNWHGPDRHVVRWPRECKEKASTSRPFDDPNAVVVYSQLRNADQVLFDTLHHSAAVVGLNTSAEIEAAIAGRPVYTIVDPAAEGQTGTLHFRYLLREQGGHVYFAESFDEHCRQLGRGVAGEYDREALERFLLAFVRPHGLGTAVSPLVADAIEAAISESVSHAAG